MRLEERTLIILIMFTN